MDRAAWGKNFKNNLKLALCAIGILAVVAIAHYAAGVSTLAQAAPVNQAASAANATGVSAAASSDIQSSQPAYSPPDNNSAPAPIGTPVAPEPDPLYPIDPIPCRGFMPLSAAGCGVCEAAPDSGSFTACWPRCPRGGIEMMCAYPLDN